jgi:hypothetical protein
MREEKEYRITNPKAYGAQSITFTESGFDDINGQWFKFQIVESWMSSQITALSEGELKERFPNAHIEEKVVTWHNSTITNLFYKKE